ncbi:MAG TPA: hypothetical protein VF798_11480 [Burkholderiaceae bacterium]
MKRALIALIATLFATVSVGAFAADGSMPHRHGQHRHHHHHRHHAVAPRP